MARANRLRVETVKPLIRSWRESEIVPTADKVSVAGGGDRLRTRNGPEKRLQAHKMRWFSAHLFAMQRAVWATVSSESDRCVNLPAGRPRLATYRKLILQPIESKSIRHVVRDGVLPVH